MYNFYKNFIENENVKYIIQLKTSFSYIMF